MHKSLHEVPTLLGVEKRLAVLNGTFGAAVTMGLHSFLIPPIVVSFHWFLKWVTKKDPHILPIYRRFTLLAPIYDPWPRAVMKTNRRPKGFSPELLC